MAEFSQDFAVVIGIDQYGSGLSSLQTAVSDVEAIAQMLQQDHHYQVTVLIDQQATLSALQHLLATVLPQQVTPDSRLLFYFAGHGIALNGEDGPEGYLIPQDARAGDTRSYLAMPALQAALCELPCRHFLGILDCCFAGAFRWSSTRDISHLPAVIHRERYDRFIRDPAWQILTSAACDQKALDAFSLSGERGQSGKHSPFAAALMEAIGGEADAYPAAGLDRPAGDGVITATELYLYLRDRVEIATAERALRQTPGLHPLKKHDKGEYIFWVPGHELNLPDAPKLDESTNPYRGLRPFEPQHSKDFFGRDGLVEQLQKFVAARPLTIVLGASGSGKSSLVKAGLIPSLIDSLNESWQLLPAIRPGEHPFDSLNQALSQAHLPGVNPLDRKKTLSQSVAAWARRSPNSQLFIFIDQSEEIITLCASQTERANFFQQILTAIDDHRTQLRLVLTLRSDFEPQVRDIGLKFVPEMLRQQGETELKSRWQRGRFMVPAMTRSELREAIEKPAEARVMFFEPHDLVETLIDEVANMPGALPLLSFALSELYTKYLERQRVAQYGGTIIDRALTRLDYEELGGVVHSLTQRANCEYQTLIDQDVAYAQTVQNVMLRMVATGGEMARRKVSAAELVYREPEDSRAKAVVDAFLAARLITTGTDVNEEIYLEPTHDALVRGWDKLLIWKSAAEEKLPLQRRLTQAANEWQQIAVSSPKKSMSFLWYTSPYLAVLAEMLRAPNHGFNRVEQDFIQQSIQQKQQQTHRRKRIAIAVTSTMSAIAIFATIQAVTAQFHLTTALRRSSAANFASNRYHFDALVDGLIAADRLRSLPGNRFMQQTQVDTKTTLAAAVFWTRERNRIAQHQNIVQAVDYSADGRLFATGSYDHTIVISYADGRLFKTLSGHESPVMSVHFSPDGQSLASASQDGTVKLWNLQDGSFQTISTNDEIVFTAQFSPDGRKLIIGGENGLAEVWSRDGQLLQTLEGHSASVRSAGFSPDGSRLFTASEEDGLFKLWNVSGDLIKTIDVSWVVMAEFSPDGQMFAITSSHGDVLLYDAEGQFLSKIEHYNEIWSIAFDNTSTVLATGSKNGDVSLWSREGDFLDDWAAHIGPINGLDFSPDGQTLITVSNDDMTKLWQVKRPWLNSLEGHRGSVNSVQFSLDQKTIVTGGRDDETVRLWNASDRTLVRILSPQNSVDDVSFNPDESIIAVGAGAGSVQLWSADGQRLRTYRPHSQRVRSLRFSPDDQTIASASEDGTAKLWSLDGKRSVSLLENAGRVLSVEFSPDGRKIATAGDDATVRIYSTEGKKLKEHRRHSNRVRQVRFSPDGQTIASASSDRTITLWDTETDTFSTLAGHSAGVLGVSFSPDGQMIASASSDHTIMLWHRDGRPITSLLGHSVDVNAIDFSPDGKWLISTDFEGKVLLWEIEDIVSLTGLIEKGCSQIKDYANTASEDLDKDLERLRKICKTR